jgi:hypothetical protein
LIGHKNIFPDAVAGQISNEKVKAAAVFFARRMQKEKNKITGKPTVLSGVSDVPTIKRKTSTFSIGNAPVI